MPSKQADGDKNQVTTIETGQASKQVVTRIKSQQ